MMKKIISNKTAQESSEQKFDQNVLVKSTRTGKSLNGLNIGRGLLIGRVLRYSSVGGSVLVEAADRMLFSVSPEDLIEVGENDVYEPEEIPAVRDFTAVKRISSNNVKPAKIKTGKRGRPRKDSTETKPVKQVVLVDGVKRGRGRPRKIV